MPSKPYTQIPVREKRPISFQFISSQRHHAVTWILEQIKDLICKAKRQTDSSKVLYACLEARNLLEMIRYSKIQCSAPTDEREGLTELAAERSGVERVNKKLKTLNQKYQDFFQAVSEDGKFPFPAFNSSECQRTLDKLHPYIHTYTISEEDMYFSSQYIQQAFQVISEATTFAKNNLVYIEKNNTYAIANIDVTNLPNWAKITLLAWKENKINSMEDLKAEIKKGVELYNQDHSELE